MARPKGIPFTEEQKAKLRGRIPWNKGLRASAETRKKLSLAKIGKVGPWRGKKRPEISGSLHHKWRGGITTENHRIRSSMEYRQWRTSVFERDDYTCQLCLKRGVTLNANHIRPFAKYKELRLELDNGITLCVPCHNKTKGKEMELISDFDHLKELDEFLIRDATKT